MAVHAPALQTPAGTLNNSYFPTTKTRAKVQS